MDKKIKNDKNRLNKDLLDKLIKLSDHLKIKFQKHSSPRKYLRTYIGDPDKGGVNGTEAKSLEKYFSQIKNINLEQNFEFPNLAKYEKLLTDNDDNDFLFKDFVSDYIREFNKQNAPNIVTFPIADLIKLIEDIYCSTYKYKRFETIIDIAHYKHRFNDEELKYPLTAVVFIIYDNADDELKDALSYFKATIYNEFNGTFDIPRTLVDKLIETFTYNNKIQQLIANSIIENKYEWQSDADILMGKSTRGFEKSTILSLDVWNNGNKSSPYYIDFLK